MCAYGRQCWNMFAGWVDGIMIMMMLLCNYGFFAINQWDMSCSDEVVSMSSLFLSWTYKSKFPKQYLSCYPIHPKRVEIRRNSASP